MPRCRTPQVKEEYTLEIIDESLDVLTEVNDAWAALEWKGGLGFLGLFQSIEELFVGMRLGFRTDRLAGFVGQPGLMCPCFVPENASGA